MYTNSTLKLEARKVVKGAKALKLSTSLFLDLQQQILVHLSIITP